MIRVCIVEDQALVRQGLVSLLRTLPDIDVAAEAGNGREALGVIAVAAPDVIVLDVRLPDIDGIEVLRALASRGPLPPTLLLTTFDDDEALIRGVLAGARGYMLKDVTRDQLADAIRTLAAGGSMIHPVASTRITRGTQPDAAPAIDRLTEREMEVLRLMAAGLSNREIGHMLGMVEGTVKNHVSNILSKLHARDRTRAVLKSFDLGWL